ncbi:MAG: Crp/Fnr family transcriptional regulator [Marinifilaceae bacterium]
MNIFLREKIKGTSACVLAQDCLNALSDEEKELWNNHKTELVFLKGETIIKQGFVASHILFIEEGMAKLDVTNDGLTSTVKILTPKNFVGIICTFASPNVDFSAVALEKTRISMIDINLFEEFIRTNGEFAKLIVKHMSALTNDLVHYLTRFSRKNIDGALAILLLDFQKIFNASRFRLPLTRKEMADTVGYSKESVINTLSKFNREGILSVSDKQIEILDEDRLVRISKAG